MLVQAHVVHASSMGQSGFFEQGMPPELLELLDDDEEDDASPPAPAEPLEELELALAPALPPVALLGSN